MTLLERIKNLCKERGISVSDLERKLDFPNNTVYQWKARVPGMDKLQKVADYFNVSIDYLIGRTNNKYLSAQMEELVNDRELNAWLYDMIENRPDDIKRVKEIMDIMVANSKKDE
ncbi:helix-turn-helix transcriptional regulator [Listeria booriae]|nr:helix-turn-helix transcriptional regulator [Listeria booriae]MBC1286904.1 helix-turn-helix transcriptional regulator [Listeria booriae]